MRNDRDRENTSKKFNQSRWDDAVYPSCLHPWLYRPCAVSKGLSYFSSCISAYFSWNYELYEWRKFSTSILIHGWVKSVNNCDANYPIVNNVATFILILFR